MNKYYCIALYFLCMTTSVTGQSSADSPYSIYGIGILKDRSSAHSRALAETGIGVQGSSHINTLNPASFVEVTGGTQISELGGFYQYNKLSTSNLNQSASAGGLSSINMWFRSSKKSGANFGLAPFSSMNYNILSKRKFTESSSVDLVFRGSGGLTQFYVGYGYSITKHLSVGFNAAYVFGNVEKEEIINSGSSSGVGVSNRTTVSKPAIDWGAQYSFPLATDKKLTFGLTYHHRLKLKTRGTVSAYEDFGQDSLFTVTKEVDDYILPQQLSGGVGLHTSRSLFAVDLKWKNWANGRLDEGMNLRNTSRLSMGYEYKGNPAPTKYIDLIVFRSGLFYENNYFTLRNQPFRNWGYSIGTGVPVSGNRGLINITYSHARTGTKSSGLVAQQSNTILLELTIKDLWGIRRKFD